jgi:hypothetical protein
MTIRVNEWYRVKSTKQFCVIQRIPSTTDPRVSIPSANERTRGFELALLWYEPTDKTLKKWIKRVMIVGLKKALSILREPNEEDGSASPLPSPLPLPVINARHLAHQPVAVQR